MYPARFLRIIFLPEVVLILPKIKVSFRFIYVVYSSGF